MFLARMLGHLAREPQILFSFSIHNPIFLGHSQWLDHPMDFPRDVGLCDSIRLTRAAASRQERENIDVRLRAFRAEQAERRKTALDAGTGWAPVPCWLNRKKIRVLGSLMEIVIIPCGKPGTSLSEFFGAVGVSVFLAEPVGATIWEIPKHTKVWHNKHGWIGPKLMKHDVFRCFEYLEWSTWRFLKYQEDVWG